MDQGMLEKIQSTLDIMFNDATSGKIDIFLIKNYLPPALSAYESFLNRMIILIEQSQEMQLQINT